jgi:hypothetical protein
MDWVMDWVMDLVMGSEGWSWDAKFHFHFRFPQQLSRLAATIITMPKVGRRKARK